MAKNKRQKKKKSSKTPTAREYRRVLDCAPSTESRSDWRLKDFEEAGFDLRSNIPDNVDLRKGQEDWWVINDQRDSGACVGWALADSVLRWHFVQSGRLDKDQLLSPRFLWMAAKETDEFTSRPESFIETAGTSLKAALKIAREYGCVPNDVLAFNSSQLYPGSTEAFYIQAAPFRINMYARLTSLKEWRRWLARKQGGPILIRVEVDQTWHRPHDGRLDDYSPYAADDPLGGGHAAAIVGYTATGDFIIRNSWGENWGDGGYALASAYYADKAISEAFGVYI